MSARKKAPKRAARKKSPARKRVATHLTDASLEALKRLMRSRKPESIADALNDVVVPYLRTPIGELGALARILRVLFMLDVEVGVHGIWRFLWSWPNSFEGGDEGAYVVEGAEFCDRIGATRAAAYLREAAAMFPGGVVPKDFPSRSHALHEFHSKESGWPLNAVDAKYKGATHEMLVALRAFIVDNRDAVVQALREATGLSEARSQLDAIVTEPDGGRFLDRLYEWGLRITNRRATPFLTDLPPTLREVLLTRMFLSDVEVSGSWKFLEHLESGAQLREFAAMCDRVGAKNAAAYVRAMPKVFPGGRFPEDEDERGDILMQLDERPGGDPLRKLDKEYAGATTELVAAYRRDVAADSAAFERRMVA